MSRRVKCYGGPMHGEYITLDDGCYRFECKTPQLVRRRMLADLRTVDLMLAIPPTTHDRMTYYLHRWQQVGRTEAGAEVFREMYVGLLEGTDILPREKSELDYDLSGQLWQWPCKPNFLKQFDQWFEYTYCEVTGKQPQVLW